MFRLAFCCVLSFVLVACNSTASSPTSTPSPSTTGLVNRLAAPTTLPPPKQDRAVIMLALPGAQGAYVERLMQNDGLPTLSRLAARGIYVRALTPPDPALSASAHASLLTGVSPAKHGIIADQFRRNGQAIGQTSYGLEQALSIEPLWRSAMRYNRRAFVIGYSPALNTWPTMRADGMIATGAALGAAAQHVVKFADAADWKNAPRSFSPLKEGRMRITLQNGSIDVWVLALDNTDDRKENFDQWLLSLSKNVDANATLIKLDEWAKLTIDPLLQATAAFKITDADPAHFALYQSAVMINQITPTELARELAQRFGPPPAPADREALLRFWIDAGTYLQMIEAQMRWQTEVAQYVQARHKPDLLLWRLTAAEDVAYLLWLTEPRQPNFQERAVRYASVVKRAHELLDESVNRLATQLDFNQHSLLIASDLGFVPVHTTVNLNRWLQERRWLTLQRNALALDLAQTRAYVEANGGIAHIYLNLKERDPGGSLEEKDVEKLQNDLIAGLKALNDPVTGQPIFARVLTKPELNALNWQAESAGDIIVQARTGFAITSLRDRTVVLEPSPFLSASGYDASLPELRGFFIATGAGINASTNVTTMHVMDVAPTVASLLRFEPPAFVEGKALENIGR